MNSNNLPKRLLVIDDEANMRHMLSTVLKKANYSVDTAADGSEGLQMIEQGQYDFVLCDIKMPKMNGMEFLKSSRDKIGCSTVIMMSAYGSIDTAIEAMKLGAYDYISKPFKTDEVYLTLKKAEERESLKKENRAFRGTVLGGTPIIGQSKSLKDTLKLADRVAPTQADRKSTRLNSSH